MAWWKFWAREPFWVAPVRPAPPEPRGVHVGDDTTSHTIFKMSGWPPHSIYEVHSAGKVVWVGDWGDFKQLLRRGAASDPSPRQSINYGETTFNDH